MNSCELISTITALAAVLAKGKTNEEIGFLAVVFTQLGDTLGTIAAHQAQCCPAPETSAPCLTDAQLPSNVAESNDHP